MRCLLVTQRKTPLGEAGFSNWAAGGSGGIGGPPVPQNAPTARKFQPIGKNILNAQRRRSRPHLSAHEDIR